MIYGKLNNELCDQCRRCDHCGNVISLSAKVKRKKDKTSNDPLLAPASTSQERVLDLYTIWSRYQVLLKYIIRNFVLDNVKSLYQSYIDDFIYNDCSEDSMSSGVRLFFNLCMSKEENIIISFINHNVGDNVDLKYKLKRFQREYNIDFNDFSILYYEKHPKEYKQFMFELCAEEVYNHIDVWHNELSEHKRNQLKDILKRTVFREIIEEYHLEKSSKYLSARTKTHI